MSNQEPVRRIFIDTATTDRWIYAEPHPTDPKRKRPVQHTDPRQPHLIRLSYILVDEYGDEQVAWSNLIRPRAGWEMSANAEAANGISLEVARERGIPLADAVALVCRAVEQATMVVMFNAEYHARVLTRACAEAGQEWNPRAEVVCAMREATNVIKKPREQPGGGYMWPKHVEAYRHFSGSELPPITIDPVLRGLSLARSIRVIHDGIIDAAIEEATVR